MLKKLLKHLDCHNWSIWDILSLHCRVKVDQSKIEIILDWPWLTNVSELRGFLGLTEYYRKFFHNYGIITRPLTNLLKKG